MKKYVALTIILSQISIAYSQADTNGSYKSRDSVVCLPKSIAKEVLKDLYRKDSLNEELVVLLKNYAILEQTSNLKDSLILNKTTIIEFQKQKETNRDSVISIKDRQIKEYEDLSKELKSDLEKSKKLNSFQWGATIVSFLLALGAMVF